MKSKQALKQVLWALMPLVAYGAQNGDDADLLQQRLEAQYTPTRTTSDRTEIVTPGASVILKKDRLVMAPTSVQDLLVNTYREGKITQRLLGKIGRASSMADTRAFMKGDKVFVTRIEIAGDAVSFEFITDRFDGSRYRAILKFPVVKGSPLVAEEIERTVGQVLAVQAP